ncbi:hypothetical protein ACFFP0_14300 [Rhizobium puerariae]|uniref:Helix-turn-helix domain-containing protein n=1 Tax=Rhizobium puerariae TaxID=1585791 RepID=A0ABV6AHG2_9HYPH
MTACPCCRAPVNVPDLYDLVDERGITGHALLILEALWDAKGARVMSDVLFDAMFADDPDGGPSPNRCYISMRLAIEELDRLLAGSGVAVVSVGHRKGYRLNLTGFDS